MKVGVDWLFGQGQSRFGIRLGIRFGVRVWVIAGARVGIGSGFGYGQGISWDSGWIGVRIHNVPCARFYEMINQHTCSSLGMAWHTLLISYWVLRGPAAWRYPSCRPHSVWYRRRPQSQRQATNESAL